MFRYTGSVIFMRKVLTIAGLSLIPLLVPSDTFACSCVYYENADQRHQAYYDNADIIIQGVPISTSSSQDGQTQTAISVEKVWKGQADAYIDVQTADNSAACGVEMKIDQPTVIFATKTDGRYTTGSCSGTAPATESQEVTEWLNRDSSSASSIAQSSSSKEAVFSDVPASHPNAEAIEFVKNAGIVSGYSDGTYKPDQYINRAEFTKIIIGATFGPEYIEGCDLPSLFPDVLSSDWFAPYVCQAKREGVIGGYPDGTFKPASNVNFAEAAKIVVIAFNLNVDKTDALSAWWKPYVYALATIGGLPTSFSDPNQLVTRGEMAEMIMRVRLGIGQ